VGQFMVAHQTGRTGLWVASDPDPGAPLMVEFTSGTTGDAKAVLHRHGQYAATFMGSCQAQGSLNGHVTVSAAPWPSKVGMRGCWRMMSIGATHVREPFPQTLAAAQTLIDGVGLNALACSPWQLRVLLREAASAPAEQLNTVRQALVHLSVGGAPVMPQELTEARRLLCANSVEVLAATEVGIIGVNTPDDPPDGRFRLAPGVVAQAVDDGGNPLAPGLPGPLRLRTPWMCDGYAQAGAAPNNAFRAGWFHSSDLGRLDADGRLALLGRADDTINTSAIKIQPRELERLLLSHPDIADAAVFAYPDDLLGELPVAFVVLARPTGMKDLHAWLAARLDRWHMPRGLAVAQALPRNADGKVQVAELRERYRQLQTPNRNP
jgi:acyl-coenzyme A synthetase/AMP-(fatty) acid ligase